jgi:hypothetical protein
MGKAKPWQIVLIVVAAVALGVSLYFSLRGDGLDLANSVTMADVATGEVFHLPIGKGANSATIPGKNPRTGDMTLMPIVQENGRWVVMEHYFPALKNIPGPHTAVNEATREVAVKGL